MAELPRIPHVSEYFAPHARIAAIVMLLVMAVLAGQLWRLQLVEGESYAERSRKNRMKVIRLQPSRGLILDSRGRVLTDNNPGFTLAVLRGELKEPRRVVETCSPILGFTPEKMQKLVAGSYSVPRFLTFPVKKNLSLEEVSLIKSRITSLKGVELEVNPRRVYPLGETLCHVTGTLGEISPQELAKRSQLGYRPGDLVGKTGIEKEYESHLKGVQGWERIEIDARGTHLESLGRKPPEQGADIVLTVDSSLQRFIEGILVQRAGSVIAVDPDTGRILAMVSKPGFDLNLFSPSISRREWKRLSTDPLHPFENRSIRGLYSPASTFKMAVAATALAEKVITPEETVTCKGALELAGQVFRCWNWSGHGKVSLRRAIEESCDVYFYELGLRLGVDRIARYASLFGLGKPTGLELPQELPGLIPTPTWKLRTYGESWKDGETLNLAIGQGYLVSTPVQLAMMTAAFANGGKVLRPAVVQQIRAPDGRIIFDHVPVVRWKIPLDGKNLSLLKESMVGVVSGAHGTGKRCRIPGIKVGGKTGTSQVIRHRQRTDEYGKIPYHERAHAIFTAYVDQMPRKIAVVVIVEHGGGGGTSAAPLARKIICRYYGIPDPGDP